jgi:hypothetical protein
MVRLHLDDTSKMVVARFGLKLTVIIFLVEVAGQRLPSVLFGTSIILCVHAIRVALILKEHPLQPTLGYWDEAAWFMTVATVTNLISHVLALQQQ